MQLPAELDGYEISCFDTQVKGLMVDWLSSAYSGRNVRSQSGQAKWLVISHLQSWPDRISPPVEATNQSILSDLLLIIAVAALVVS